MELWKKNYGFVSDFTDHSTLNGCVYGHRMKKKSNVGPFVEESSRLLLNEFIMASSAYQSIVGSKVKPSIL